MSNVFAGAVSWQAALARIAEARFSRIMVLGERDVGKSSLCAGLLGLEDAEPFALLDMDLGQKMVGPPVSVTLGRLAGDGTLALDGLSFVGTLSPPGREHWLIEGARDLLSICEKRVVINTSGLLSGFGLNLKLGKIRALAPDLLVLIGEHPTLDALMASSPKIATLRLPLPPEVKRKSKGVRRANRQAAFAFYFSDAEEQDLAFSSLQVLGDPALLSTPDLLVGLCAPPSPFWTMALLKAADIERNRLSVLAPPFPLPPSLLRLGALYLTAAWDAEAVPSATPLPVTPKK